MVIVKSDNDSELRDVPITVKVLQECQEAKEESRAIFEALSELKTEQAKLSELIPLSAADSV